MIDLAAITSTPRRIRQANAAAALKALFTHGRLSRAELARHLGLNRSSSGHIVVELTEGALVREVADEKPDRTAPARAGRPGILLELVPEAAVFLGAEIGVEHITTVCIDLNADIRASRVVPFDGRSVSAPEVVRRAAQLALEEIPPGMTARCEGFGLAVPGQMDVHGHLRIAPILGWRDVDLQSLARAALPVGMPVLVENDANAFAIGEGYKCGYGRSGVTLFLVIESGVGGGIVIDGKLFQGAHGLAGEIGHIQIPEGNGQELEELIGLERLLTRHRMASGRADATLEGFLADVRDRAPQAVAIAEEWARHLAFAIVQTGRFIDPDRIVLGGSVAALYPMVAARVAIYIRAGQAPTFPVPEILVHEAPEMGAAFGAACKLHQRYLSLEGEHPADDVGPKIAGPA